MLLGHYAVAFAAKRAAPQTSLGTLILAAQLPDLLWPILLLAGLESVRVDPGNTAFTPLDFVSYPISHSLLAVLGWGAALGGVYMLIRRYRRGAWVVGLAVVSHWILDAVTHRPDLPITPGGDTLVGLGLWNSVPATLVLELALFAGAVGLYARTAPAADATGRWAFRGLVATLALIYLGNLLGGAPPGPTEIAVVSLGLWFFVPWGYWIDRHRPVRAGPRA
jgi:hypothetical protein